MKYAVYVLALFLITSSYTSAQTRALLGPNIGFALPQMHITDGAIDRPGPGSVIGIRADILAPVNPALSLGVGLQAYIYYFAHSTAYYGSEPLDPLGLNFGVPITMRAQLPVAHNVSWLVSGGIMPLLETGGLARFTESDGAMRFNIAPVAGTGFLIFHNVAIGLRWYMPLRQYGSAYYRSTYSLHTYTFDVMYSLKPRVKAAKKPVRR